MQSRPPVFFSIEIATKIHHQRGDHVGEQGRFEEDQGQVWDEPHEGGAQARHRLGRCVASGVKAEIMVALALSL